MMAKQEKIIKEEKIIKREKKEIKSVKKLIKKVEDPAAAKKEEDAKKKEKPKPKKDVGLVPDPPPFECFYIMYPEKDSKGRDVVLEIEQKDKYHPKKTGLYNVRFHPFEGGEEEEGEEEEGEEGEEHHDHVQF